MGLKCLILSYSIVFLLLMTLGYGCVAKNKKQEIKTHNFKPRHFLEQSG
jgi:hypothetical protein